jgi:hypothetical protein
MAVILPPGATAGIIIGSIVVGAIMGFVATKLLTPPFKLPPHVTAFAGGKYYINLQRVGLAIRTGFKGRNGTDYSVDAGKAWSRLEYEIGQFVRFVDQPDAPPLDMAELQRVAGDSCDCAQLLSGDVDWRLRRDALHSLLWRWVTPLMDLDGDPSTTLLPPDLVRLQKLVMSHKQRTAPFLNSIHRLWTFLTVQYA